MTVMMHIFLIKYIYFSVRVCLLLVLLVCLKQHDKKKWIDAQTLKGSITATIKKYDS